MRNSRGESRLPIILLSLAAAAATWLIAKDKPAAIDDPYFLLAAESILKNPLRPFDFVINWEGFDVPGQVYSLYDPPLWPAVLAAFMKLGGSEAFLHLAQVPFHALALLAIYFLAREFSASPAIAWAAASLSPALLIPASTLMPDVAAISMAWWGLWFFLRSASRSWHAPAGALCFVLAGLTKFSIFPLIAVAAAAVWWRRDKMGRGLAWIAASLVLLSIWPSIQMFAHSAQSVFRLPLWNNMWHHVMLINKAAYAPAALGAAFFFPPAWLALLGARLLDSRGLKRLLYAFFVSAAVMTAAYILGAWGYSKIQMPGWGPPHGASALWFLASIFLFLSWVLALAAETLKGTRARRDPKLFLLIWIAVIIAGVVFFSPFPNVRFLLPAFPPVAILALGEIEKFRSRNAARWVQAAVLASTAWLGSSLLQSDIRQAQCSPDLLAKVREMYPNRRMFTTGHWGMQYYARDLGILQTTIPGREPREGDLVLSPYVTHSHPLTLKKGLESRGLATLSCSGKGSILRTMDRDSGAGFYGMSWVPYSFSGNEMEVLFVNEIAPRPLEPGRRGR